MKKSQLIDLDYFKRNPEDSLEIFTGIKHIFISVLTEPSYKDFSITLVELLKLLEHGMYPVGGAGVEVFELDIEDSPVGRLGAVTLQVIKERGIKAKRVLRY
jgi:hypothetical protein